MVPNYREEFDLDSLRFTCNRCGVDVSDTPCPEHAPVDVPGLRLVDCTANPRHMLWVHDCDDYGVPCFYCLHLDALRRERQDRQCRHWPWRSWRITGRLAYILRKIGVIRGWAVTWGDGHDGCVSFHFGSRLPVAL